MAWSTSSLRAAGPATAAAGRYRLWDLVGVELHAFGRFERLRHLHRVAFMAGMAMAMWAYERHVHPSGRAVCLLGPRPARIAAATTGLVLAFGLVAAMSQAVAEGLLAAVALVLLPLAIPAARALLASARLRRLTPSRGRVYVHSLASTEAGKGADLLRSITKEADEKGLSLVLDAENERLARYYEAFGFQRRGTAVRMPNGAFRIRMWRPSTDQIRRP